MSHNQKTTGSKVLFFDLESDGLLDSITKIHSLCLGPLEGPIVTAGPDPLSIQAALQALSEADEIIGHNIINFDVKAIEKLYPDWKRPKKVTDTRVLTRLAYPHMYQVDAVKNQTKLEKKEFGGHKLATWGKRLGILKGDYGAQDGAWEQWSQEMEDYCIQDVAVTIALWKHIQECKLPQAAIDTEMAFQEIIVAMEHQGFHFDIMGAQILAAKLRDRQTVLLDQLQTTFPPVEPVCLGVYGNQSKRAERLLAEQGWELDDAIDKMDWLKESGIKFKWTKRIPFNPNSNQQIEERLRGLGWSPVDFTPKGQAKLDEPILIDIGRRFSDAHPLVEYALVTKRLSQIADGDSAWLKKVGDDGRMHGWVDSMGAITYRCTHNGPNMAQVPSVKAPFGKECRGFFYVPEGWKLVGCDVAGLELRALATYLHRFDGGKYRDVVLDGDIHTMNQQAAGLSTRDQAKTFIYAFLYGAGDAKLGSVALPDERDMNVLRREGKKLKRRFYAKVPAIKRLSEAVRQKVAREKTLTAVDGRVLRVRSAHSALNTLLQSWGAIVTKMATNNFRTLLESDGYMMSRDWCLVAHVHDEWQTICREEIAPHVAAVAVKAIELVGEQLRLSCPVTGESKIGQNWAETH